MNKLGDLIEDYQLKSKHASRLAADVELKTLRENITVLAEFYYRYEFVTN